MSDFRPSGQCPIEQEGENGLTQENGELLPVRFHPGPIGGWTRRAGSD